MLEAAARPPGLLRPPAPAGKVSSDDGGVLCARPGEPAPSALVTAGLVVASVLCAALSLGVLVPLPVVGYAALLGAWGMVASLVLAAALVVALWAARPGAPRARRLAVALLAASLAATLVAAGAQARQAQALGADLRWWDTTGVGQQGQLPDAEPVVLEDTDTGQRLRAGVWLPRDPGTGKVLSPEQVRASHPQGVPVVVLVHGGGWRTGDRRNPMTKGQATWLARQGYLAVALDYPLSTPQQPTWWLAESRVAYGLSWVGREAAQWGGDANRLALVGDSSGGHLALEVAERQALGELHEICPEPVPQVRAVSLTYPVADPVGFHDNTDPVMSPFVAERAAMFTGASPTQAPERYTAISPLAKAQELGRRGLGGRMPPVLVVHGQRDHVVPVAGARLLDQELSRAGAPSRLVVVPYADHVFDLNPGSVPSQLWRHLTLELLASQGLAP